MTLIKVSNISSLNFLICEMGVIIVPKSEWPWRWKEVTHACKILNAWIFRALISMHYAQMLCTGWKKPALKGYLLYNFIYLTFQKGQNYRDIKQISASQELRVGKGADDKGTQKNLGGDETVLYLDYGGGGYKTWCVCQTFRIVN